MFERAVLDAGGKIYEVGGSVRDKLLKKEKKDKDYLVTGIPLEKLERLLKKFGKVAFVGKSFGVLKLDGHDIAIPRKEVSTGVGHRDFQVTYDHTIPVELDLARRDFTINAMAWECATGRLIDPFDGQTDLKKRVLRQVFKEAFQEDPLRLLRAVQFAARFELTIEPETFASMRAHAPLIKTVSAERIVMEIVKLFLAQRPSIGFQIMDTTGLLELVFPELAATKGIAQEKKPNDDVFKHIMRSLDAAASDPEVESCGDPELMFAVLFHDVGKAKTARYIDEKKRIAFYGHQLVSKRIARKKLDELKCTTMGIDPQRVAKLIEHHMFETKSFFSDKAIRRFINKVGKDLIFKLIDLRIADNRGGKYGGIGGVLKLKKRIIEELSRKPPFGPKDLAVNGHDLMTLGIPEGPGLGAIIKQLMEVVLDDPELNTKERLLEIARDLSRGGALPPPT